MQIRIQSFKRKSRQIEGFHFNGKPLILALLVDFCRQK